MTRRRVSQTSIGGFDIVDVFRAVKPLSRKDFAKASQTSIRGREERYIKRAFSLSWRRFSLVSLLSRARIDICDKPSAGLTAEP
jgi:hypothetical protein